jgi:hypothetical protein
MLITKSTEERLQALYASDMFMSDIYVGTHESYPRGKDDKLPDSRKCSWISGPTPEMRLLSLGPLYERLEGWTHGRAWPGHIMFDVKTYLTSHVNIECLRTMAMMANIEFADVTKPDLISALVNENVKFVTPIHCVAFLTALVEVNNTPPTREPGQLLTSELESQGLTGMIIHFLILCFARTVFTCSITFARRTSCALFE